jgi:hypothetical protein
MSDDPDPMDGFLVQVHPDADAILADYPVGTVLELITGQNFVVGHHGSQGLVIVPITAEEAERVCSCYVAPITNGSSVN